MMSIWTNSRREEKDLWESFSQLLPELRQLQEKITVLNRRETIRFLSSSLTPNKP